ncbi:trypsin-like peptidase domain-containing protein [Clostridium beijerinckii]|uniref:trypsin-like peptidase domain-containing protein n=1 Tax=Clostridium beijerinckii TaxID=1520 RepID=UPI000809A7FD|nr:trypsin-like peptidase domain-containing protein [Clostridium beijerinckii]OCB00111.1 hypothetical protein BGS1_12730 [Clostridium beijerinckii]
MVIEKELLNLSVRIERFVLGSENEILGSGIWWEPNKISEYIYIFTAAHVVLDKKDIIVRYLDKDQKDLEVKIEDNNIVCHRDKKIKEGELPSRDVAVLRCRRQDADKAVTNSYKLQTVENLKENRKMILIGFPDVLFQKSSFALSNKTLNMTFESPDKQEKRFKYRMDSSVGIKQYEANDQLVGFSGAGIFHNNNSELLLLGINSSSLGENADLNTCAGMSSELIVEICKEKGWNIPVMANSVVGNLEDAVNNFLNDIDNDDLNEIMKQIIENDFEKVIKSNFCGISKECENISCSHQCQTFRNNLLIILCILKYLNDSIEFDKASIDNEGKSIPVRYVCCDGELELNKITLGSFINSLKNDYLMNNKIEENSLILWGTKKIIKGSEKYCTPKGFRKIIKDIKGSYKSNKGFDIKKGLTQPKELAIIEINALIENIKEDTLEDMINFIKQSIAN